MKKNILLDLVLLLGITLQSFAQTADEVINKYVEANGGIEKLNQLKYVIKVGVLELFDQEYPVKLWVSNLKGFKSEIEMEGFKSYSLVNSKEGFIYVSEEEELQPIPDDTYKQAAFNLNLLPAFINYAENNSTVEFKGTMELNNAIAYKLEVTRQDGQKIDYFIDIKTGYILKTVLYSDQKPGTTLTEINYSDFRVVNDKYIFPFNISDKFGTFQFSSIEANVPIDETIFKP